MGFSIFFKYKVVCFSTSSMVVVTLYNLMKIGIVNLFLNMFRSAENDYFLCIPKMNLYFEMVPKKTDYRFSLNFTDKLELV